VARSERKPRDPSPRGREFCTASAYRNLRREHRSGRRPQDTSLPSARAPRGGPRHRATTALFLFRSLLSARASSPRSSVPPSFPSPSRASCCSPRFLFFLPGKWTKLSRPRVHCALPCSWEAPTLPLTRYAFSSSFEHRKHFHANGTANGASYFPTARVSDARQKSVSRESALRRATTMRYLSRSSQIFNHASLSLPKRARVESGFPDERTVRASRASSRFRGFGDLVAAIIRDPAYVRRHCDRTNCRCNQELSRRKGSFSAALRAACHSCPCHHLGTFGTSRRK